MNKDLILVAEFMGGALYPEFTSSIYPDPEPTIVYDLPPTDSASKLWAVTELRYDVDRDWLNPVLDKIFNLTGKYNFDIVLFAHQTSLRDAFLTESVNQIFNRVVKFIKWYNNEIHHN